MSTPDYTLHYFPLRCRGEASRLIAAAGGLALGDVRVGFSDWPALKASMPWGQLPVLELADGKQICQSTAIARFLAKEAGLAGKTRVEEAEADMLVDGAMGLWDSLTPVYMPLFQSDRGGMEAQWAKVRDSLVQPALDRFDARLAGSKSGWLVGDAMTWADVVLAEFLSVVHDSFDPTILTQHPDRQAFVNKVFGMPGIKDHVESRPKDMF